MRIGRRLAEQDQCEFGRSAECARRRSHQRRDVAIAHSLADTRGGPAIGGNGNIGRRLHQRDLGGRFAHPDTAHDRRGGNQRCAGQGLREAVGGKEAHRLLDPDAPIGQPALGQDVADQLGRALMLVPGTNIGIDTKRFGDRRAFEKGRDDHRRAAGGNDRGGQALATPPAYSGKIDHARARFHDDRADIVGRHQRLRTGKPRSALITANRRDITGELREIRSVDFGGAQQARRGERQAGSSQRCAAEQIATVDHDVTHRHKLLRRRARPGRRAAHGCGRASRPAAAAMPLVRHDCALPPAGNSSSHRRR